MITQNPSVTMTNREFIALVRAKLDTADRQDVAIDRLWIDEDEPGYSFLLNVPVGPELVVPLKPTNDFFDCPTGNLDWHIDYFATALINLKSAEKMLTTYAQDIRREARKQIAAARAEGLDVSIVNVGFKPTYAWHMSGKDWRAAAYHVLAEIKLRHTSFFLRPKTSSIWVEQPSNVAMEIEPLLKEQRDRQARLAEMNAKGADLELDAITLDLLAAHGLDAVEILTKLWKTQCVNLKIQHLGRDAKLSLISSNGKVTAGIVLENAFWNGKHLWFPQGCSQTNYEDLVGKTLVGLIDHPAFGSHVVVKVESGREHGRPDLIHIDLSRKLLFDADSGRIWPQHNCLAA